LVETNPAELLDSGRDPLAQKLNYSKEIPLPLTEDHVVPPSALLVVPAFDQAGDAQMVGAYTYTVHYTYHRLNVDSNTDGGHE
jgi:hypothetical protein